MAKALPADPVAARRGPGRQGRDVTCDVCGGPTVEVRCKITCRRCGFTRDCSDP